MNKGNDGLVGARATLFKRIDAQSKVKSYKKSKYHLFSVFLFKSAEWEI